MVGAEAATLCCRITNRKVGREVRRFPTTTQGLLALAEWLENAGNGIRLQIMSSWLVFEDDLRIQATVAGPLDLLMCFAEAFGLPLVVGKQQRGKFILYEFVSLPPTQIGVAKSAQKVDLETFVRFNAKKGGTEIAYAYAIDINAYEQSLLAHGVVAGANALVERDLMRRR